MFCQKMWMQVFFWWNYFHSFFDQIEKRYCNKVQVSIAQVRFSYYDIDTTYAVYYVTLSTEWPSISGRHQRKFPLSHLWPSQQCLVSYCYSYLYWLMQWLIGVWSKEFGCASMLLWVPVAENTRNMELLLTYKCRTWMWISIKDV